MCESILWYKLRHREQQEEIATLKAERDEIQAQVHGKYGLRHLQTRVQELEGRYAKTWDYENDASRYRKALEEIIKQGHQEWPNGKHLPKDVCSACIATEAIGEGKGGDKK